MLVRCVQTWQTTKITCGLDVISITFNPIHQSWQDEVVVPESLCTTGIDADAVMSVSMPPPLPGASWQEITQCRHLLPVPGVDLQVYQCSIIIEYWWILLVWFWMYRLKSFKIMVNLFQKSRNWHTYFCLEKDRFLSIWYSSFSMLRPEQLKNIAFAGPTCDSCKVGGAGTFCSADQHGRPAHLVFQWQRAQFHCTDLKKTSRHCRVWLSSNILHGPGTAGSLQGSFPPYPPRSRTSFIMF